MIPGPDNRGFATLAARLAGPTRRFILAALMLPLVAGLAAAPGEAAPSKGHVYLYRGLMNVFSLGMDDIAKQLRAQGIEATVYNHMSWPTVAEEIAAAHKSGKVRRVVIVGHSAGAAAVTSTTAELDRLGVPVHLAIGLDPLTSRKVSKNVRRYINYYVWGQPVSKGDGFKGNLQNVNLKGANVDHFNIDKDKAVQARIISAIRSAL